MVTVHGTGVPGFFVNLYANGVRVGSVQVAADGTFAVTSSALKNGLFKLQIAHMISTGAESDLVSADSVTIAVNTTIDPVSSQKQRSSSTDNKLGYLNPTFPFLSFFSAHGSASRYLHKRQQGLDLWHWKPRSRHQSLRRWPARR